MKKLYEYQVFGNLVEVPELTNILKGYIYHVYKDKDGDVYYQPNKNTYTVSGAVMSVVYSPNMNSFIVNTAKGNKYNQIDLADFIYNYLNSDEISQEDFEILAHYAENPDEYKYDFGVAVPPRRNLDDEEYDIDLAESKSDVKKDRNTLKKLVESYGKDDVIKYIKHLNLLSE